MTYRIRFRGPLSRQLVRWIERLIPLLRQAPADIEVTVEIHAPRDERETPGDAVESEDDKAPRRRENDPGHGPQE